MDELDYAQLPIPRKAREKLKRLNAARIRCFLEKVNSAPDDVQKHDDAELLKGRLRDYWACLLEMPSTLGQRTQWLQDYAKLIRADRNVLKVVSTAARKHLGHEDHLAMLARRQMPMLLESLCGELLAQSTETELPSPPPQEPRESSNQDGSKITTNRDAVDAFLLKCKQETSVKVIRKYIWRAADHKFARQFQRWQAGDQRATVRDEQNFRRIVAMRPKEFVALLKQKRII